MEKQILVLKTSLAAKSDVEKVGILLGKLPQIVEWNIDDKTLRIECYGLTEELIAVLLRRAGIKAEKLY